MTRALLLLLALGLGACIPDPQRNSPIMRPGEDCMTCHSPTGRARKLTWTVAGTLYADAQGTPAEGALVLLRDKTGRELTLRANWGGNFYTAEELVFPLATVQVQFGTMRVAMSSPPPNGACNACHANPGIDGAPGQLQIPPP